MLKTPLIASSLSAEANDVATARDFYLSLLENAPALVWRAGIDAKCDWFNAGWLNFTGRKMEQEIGDGWVEGVHPEDLARCVKHYLDAFHRRESFRMEYRLRRHDGQYRWITDHGVPFIAQQGEFGGYIGYCFDITEQRETLDALREGEARMTAIGENLPESFIFRFTLTAYGLPKFYHVSRSVMAVMGFTAEAVMADGRLLLDRISPACRQNFDAVVGKCLCEASDCQIELQALHADGRLRWLRLASRAHLLGDKTYVWDGVATDITEKKWAEAAVHQSRELLKLVLNTIPQSVFWKDRDSRYLGCNKTFAQAAGVADPEQIVGKSDLDLPWANHEAEKYRADDQTVMASGRAHNHLIETQWAADGSRAWVDTSKVPLVDKSGNIFGVLGIYEDITELKRTEAQLQEGMRFRREAEKIARIGAWKVSLLLDYVYWTEGVYSIIEAPLDYKPGIQEGLKFYDSEFRPRLQAALQAAIDDGTPFIIEARVTTMSGRRLWAEVRGLGRVEEGGNVFVMGTFQDITERKHREIRNRLHLDTLQLMATNTPIPLVLESVVDLLECGRDDWHGSIMLVKKNGTSLFCGAAPRLPEYLREAFNDVPIQPGVGSCGEAAATRKKVMIEDIATHPNWAAFRELTGRAGLRACWSIPIISASSEILGALAVYRSQPSLPSHEEMRAMEEIMDLAAVAISQAKSEAALRENRQRLRMALDAAVMGVWEYDFTTDKLYWSPEIFKNLGVPKMEPSREKMAGMLHPEDVAIPQKAMDKAHAGHQPYHCEYRVVIGDRTIWVEDRGQVLWDELDRPVKVIGTAQDITMRKQSEEASRRLMVAIDQSVEGIMFTDLAGKVIYINSGYEKICGYPRDELIGRNMEVLQSGKHSPEFFRQLWATLNQGEVWRGRFINRRKDGTLFEEDATITPIRNAKGEITSYVATKHDVTRESALERQLIEAQKMDAIGKLAGGVAHDYNNILAASVLQLELMQNSPNLPAEMRDGLAELLRGANRAAGLTRQLLLFSRRQAMEKKAVELIALQDHSLKMLRRLLGEHIELLTHSRLNEAWIEADSGMIEQVLMNLCINARDAMPKGGKLTVGIEVVDVEVAKHPHPDARPGRHVCLSVQDTGFGMSAEVLPRIFEPFFTTKEIGKGTGLGLATVHGIVKQHNGWIEVASQPGKGSEFHVYFPEVAPPKSSRPAAASFGKIVGGSETLLVVEDEDSLRKPLVKWLSNAGYKIHEAANAQEAITQWGPRADELDLLLTDMVMPGGMTGLDLAEALNKIKPTLPVIITSGYSQQLLNPDAREKPNFCFLGKPCDPQKLRSVIRKMLESKPAPVKN